MPGVGADRRPDVEAQTVLRPSIEPRTLTSAVGAVALPQPPSGALPAPTPATERQEAAATLEPVLLPPFTIYEIEPGDTLSSIAQRFGLDVQYLLWNNPGVHDPDALVPGNKLIIPAGNGILHEVRLGETLSDIAERYGVTVEDIVNFAPNNIKQADSIIETQLVYVPNGRIQEVAVAAAPPPPAPPAAGDAAVEAPPPAAPPPAPAAPAAPATSTGLIWPFSGPISSYMGPGHPLGIDIDGYNNPSGAVVASTSGTVIFAGGNPNVSYGLYVIVRSADGIETLYAHLSQIYVAQGQTVAQGEALGVVGCTGYCTGTHLHFEVLIGGVRVNPLDYLP
ncbi:MAG TPA: peptidoglycan DD-metalloendopeptidase family protein [Dehalococcoidia bacterium]|nr:peptidoglycan DD-metalloendopeptidase family protein [Dehalococcoidia bacterium]